MTNVVELPVKKKKVIRHTIELVISAYELQVIQEVEKEIKAAVRQIINDRKVKKIVH